MLRTLHPVIRLVHMKTCLPLAYPKIHPVSPRHTCSRYINIHTCTCIEIIYTVGWGFRFYDSVGPSESSSCCSVI